MAANAMAVRRQRMDEFVAPDPLDEVVQRPVRMALRQWMKIDAIADGLAAEGKVSPDTNRPVSGNDVMRSFANTGIRNHEAVNGEIRLQAVARGGAKKRKPAAKKGRK